MILVFHFFLEGFGEERGVILHFILLEPDKWITAYLPLDDPMNPKPTSLKFYEFPVLVDQRFKNTLI